MQIQLDENITLKHLSNTEVSLSYSGNVTRTGTPAAITMKGEVYADNESIAEISFTSNEDGTFHVVQTLLKEQLSQELDLVVAVVDAAGEETGYINRTIGDLLSDDMIGPDVKSGDESLGALLDTDAETIKEVLTAEETVEKKLPPETVEEPIEEEPVAETGEEPLEEEPTAETVEAPVEKETVSGTVTEEGFPKDKVSLMALIESRTDINQTDADGNTILVNALYYSDDEAVQWVLDQEPDVTPVNQDGETALYVAVKQNRDKALIEQLLSKGADIQASNTVGDTILMEALWFADDETVNYLLDQGAAANVANRQGRTTLHFAVKQQRGKEILESLLNSGANINLRDNAGDTVLIEAIWHADDDVVQYLVDKGADLKAVNQQAETALLLAVEKRKRSKELIEYLIKNGADLNVRDPRDESSILMRSIQRSKDREILELLIKNSADLNVRDRDGFTVLMYAIKGANRELIPFILEHDVDVNAVNRYGETALSLAVKERHSKALLAQLVNKGADLNWSEPNGDTILMLALKYIRDDEFIELLLEHGADVKAINQHDKTAFDIAELERRSSAILERLQ